MSKSLHEALNSLFEKAAEAKTKYYKEFLLKRYGIVPDIAELADFYKNHKITVRCCTNMDDEIFTVREKGHKVFVMRTTTELDFESGRIDALVKVEKSVSKRRNNDHTREERRD